MIIDLQIHLWEADRPDRPWNDSAPPSLPEPFGPEQFLPMMDAAGVDAAVIVPPGHMGFNSEYGLEVAAAYPDRFSVMGLIDPVAPDIVEQVRNWRSRPGMIGVRTHINERRRARWGDDRAADPFWAACAEYGVPVAVFAAGSIAYADDLARRFPSLKLIIDHLGLPMIDEGFEYPEFDAMLTLARHPGVAVKMSTLGSRSLTGYPFVETHGMVRRVYDTYGPERMFWATDHTQQMKRNRATYQEQLDLFRVALDFLSARDRELILGEAAQRYLGWPATS